MVLRAITERPVAGGEKFSVSIGPSPPARHGLRWLRGLTAGSATVGAVVLVAGGGGAGLVGAAGLLVLTLGAEWLAGGSEFLVCQGEVLAHRRRRLGIERRRSLPVLDVRRVRPPGGRGRRAETRGLRIEARDEVRAVGEGIAWVEACELAEALERHLAASSRPGASRTADRLHPSRSAPSRAPARTRPEAVLRFRNPPPR